MIRDRHRWRNKKMPSRYRRSPTLIIRKLLVGKRREVVADGKVSSSMSDLYGNYAKA